MNHEGPTTLHPFHSMCTHLLYCGSPVQVVASHVSIGGGAGVDGVGEVGGASEVPLSAKHTLCKRVRTVNIAH